MKKEKIPFSQKAKYKMIIYFKDGKARTFYSRHEKNDQKAITQLRNLIKKWSGRYDTALIYENTGQKPLIEKYVKDLKVAI